MAALSVPGPDDTVRLLRRVAGGVAFGLVLGIAHLVARHGDTSDDD